MTPQTIFRKSVCRGRAARRGGTPKQAPLWPGERAERAQAPPPPPTNPQRRRRRPRERCGPTCAAVIHVANRSITAQLRAARRVGAPTPTADCPSSLPMTYPANNPTFKRVRPILRGDSVADRARSHIMACVCLLQQGRPRRRRRAPARHEDAAELRGDGGGSEQGASEEEELRAAATARKRRKKGPRLPLLSAGESAPAPSQGAPPRAPLGSLHDRSIVRAPPLHAALTQRPLQNMHGGPACRAHTRVTRVRSRAPERQQGPLTTAPRERQGRPQRALGSASLNFLKGLDTYRPRLYVAGGVARESGRLRTRAGPPCVRAVVHPNARSYVLRPETRVYKMRALTRAPPANLNPTTPPPRAVLLTKVAAESGRRLHAL